MDNVFLARSDSRLLILEMVSAIHLPDVLMSRARFISFLRKKVLFVAGYPMVLYILKQLFTSVKSGRYFPSRFAGRQISITIHFHFGE